MAGALVVAACLLPAGFDVTGIRDSKQLSESARVQIYDRLVAVAKFEIVVVAPPEIDRLNILRATLESMSFALFRLQATQARIDGNQLPRPIPEGCQCECLVKGDDKDAAIAAASILAKVTRDRLMQEADREYPGYGFASNKGYGDAKHLAALQEKGPCPIHRKSFEPVRTMIQQPKLEF